MDYLLWVGSSFLEHQVACFFQGSHNFIVRGAGRELPWVRDKDFITHTRTSSINCMFVSVLFDSWVLLGKQRGSSGCYTGCELTFQLRNHSLDHFSLLQWTATQPAQTPQGEALSSVYWTVNKPVLCPGGRQFINILEKIVMNVHNCEKPMENCLSTAQPSKDVGWKLSRQEVQRDTQAWHVWGRKRRWVWVECSEMGTMCRRGDLKGTQGPGLEGLSSHGFVFKNQSVNLWLEKFS